MTTNREVYEGKILETLIKNSERLAVVEQKLTNVEQKLDQRIDKVDAKLNWLLGLVATVGLGILASLYSQPILNALN